jgi:hypothetical protein
LQTLTCCYFWSAVRNHIRPDTRPQIKERKNQHVHPAVCSYVHWLLRYASTIIYCWHHATTTTVQMIAPVLEIMDMSGTWSMQEVWKLFLRFCLWSSILLLSEFSASSRMIAGSTFAGIFLPLMFLWPLSCLLWMHPVTLQVGFHSW